MDKQEKRVVQGILNDYCIPGLLGDDDLADHFLLEDRLEVVGSNLVKGNGKRSPVGDGDRAHAAKVLPGLDIDCDDTVGFEGIIVDEDNLAAHRYVHGRTRGNCQVRVKGNGL